MKWEMEKGNYLTISDWNQLADSLEEHARADLEGGRVRGVRAWMLCDFCYQTGFRVGELINVQIKHLVLDGSPQAGVWIMSLKKKKKDKNGKKINHRPAWVPFGLELAEHLKAYLKFKKRIGEPTGDGDYLFVNRGHKMYTTRALQTMFKGALKRAGLKYGSANKGLGFSIHCLRHSCGTHLFAHTKNLRAVQKQLRITTTEVYADVTPEEVRQ